MNFVSLYYCKTLQTLCSRDLKAPCVSAKSEGAQRAGKIHNYTICPPAGVTISNFRLILGVSKRITLQVALNTPNFWHSCPRTTTQQVSVGTWNICVAYKLHTPKAFPWEHKATRVLYSNLYFQHFLRELRHFRLFSERFLFSWCCFNTLEGRFCSLWCSQS